MALSISHSYNSFKKHLSSSSVTSSITLSSRNKLAKLNERVDDTKEDVKSVLRYQEERNMQIQSELDELRDEVSCCYEHFEEYKKIEDNGR